MTTKEIVAKKLKLQEVKSSLMDKHIKPLCSEISLLEEARIRSIIDNKEYLVDLSEYEGKTILYLTALKSDGDNEYLPTDETIEVENGRIYCSSCQGGIVEWSESKNCYIHAFHMNYKELDILGFIDIEIESDRV